MNLAACLQDGLQSCGYVRHPVGFVPLPPGQRRPRSPCHQPVAGRPPAAAPRGTRPWSLADPHPLTPPHAFTPPPVQMMDYNVPLGKLNRGMAVLDVVRCLAEARGQQLSEEELFRAQALGWCIEFLQARG